MAGGLPEPRPRVLFDAHTRAFAAIGRMPRWGISDNMMYGAHGNWYDDPDLTVRVFSLKQ